VLLIADSLNPNRGYEVIWRGLPSNDAPIGVADSNGHLSLSMTVGANALPGMYIVDLVSLAGGMTNASEFTFTVTSANDLDKRNPVVQSDIGFHGRTRIDADENMSMFLASPGNSDSTSDRVSGIVSADQVPTGLVSSIDGYVGSRQIGGISLGDCQALQSPGRSPGLYCYVVTQLSGNSAVVMLAPATSISLSSLQFNVVADFQQLSDGSWQMYRSCSAPPGGQLPSDCPGPGGVNGPEA
jgi:hypothetical protein